MKNSNRNNGRGNAAASDMIVPGIELWKQHKRETGFKTWGLLAWWGVILGVAALFSMITGSVLTRFMEDYMAYGLSILMHCGLALGTHLLFVGLIRHNRLKKNIGIGVSAFFTVALFVLCVLRVTAMMEEERPAASAWALSLFLFMLEVTIPVGLGYVAALLDVARGKAREELVYFRNLKGRLQSRENPQMVWPDAIASLSKNAEEREDRLETARPEDVAMLEEEIEVLENRLDEVKEWDPTQSYQRREKAVVVIPAQMPPTPMAPESAATPNWSPEWSPETPSRTIHIPVTRSGAAEERSKETAEHSNGSKVRW